MTARARVKECDVVKVGDYPTMKNFRFWKNSVIQEVCAASGRGDQFVKWIRKAFNLDYPYERLGNPSLLHQSIDTKLANALNLMVRGEVERSATSRTE